jgi:DnaJ family protein B protein 6
MDDGDNAYQVLGVPEDATEDQIKKAYRKLALKHHPDKQSTDELRQQAPAVFAKISNAYELLSDPNKRQEYDYERRQDHTSPQPSSSRSRRSSRHHRHDDHFENHFDHYRFHNPFEIFEQVFRQEFGRNGGGGRSPFDDPFFTQNPMGGMGMGGMGMGSPFGSMMGVGDAFGGNSSSRGGGDPFAMMRHQHQGMMQQQHQGMMQQPMMGTSFRSSSTNMGGGPGMISTSTSTTTRVVNGRRQSVTETVVRKPDGSVERHVQTDGDDYVEEPRRRLAGGSRSRSDREQSVSDVHEDTELKKQKKRKK